VTESKKAEMAQKQKEALRRAMIFYEEGRKKWENSSPDLRNPDRMVKNFCSKPVTQLMIFIHLRQINQVKRLLEAGADPNKRIKLDDATALIIALQNRNIEIAKLLLEHPKIAESINARTRRKKITALEVAIEKGYVGIVRRLIEKGADIELFCDIEYISPLYNAITSFYAIEKFRATGMPPPIPKENQSADVFRRRSAFGEVFLSGNVFNQDFPNRDALLMEKLQNASPEYVKRFKQVSNDLFERRDVNTDFSKLLQIIDILIEAGADVNKLHNKPHQHGFTPFSYSAEIGDIEVFRRLYEAGGKEHLTDCVADDNSILNIAIAYSNFDIAAYILEHGDKKQLRQIINNQNKKEGDKNGYSALHFFIKGFWELKRNKLYSDETMNDWKQTVWGKLLDLEPDLTLKNKKGLTAEMFADSLAMPLFAVDLQKRRKGV
jgi:ankyrin repeat protein